MPPVPVWKLTAVQVLAFACFGAALGVWVKKKLPVLDRLNIPASIVGGLVYALGYRIDAIANPFGATIELGWLGLPFTLPVRSRRLHLIRE